MRGISLTEADFRCAAHVGFPSPCLSVNGGSTNVESIEIHHLAPRGDEVLHELVPSVIASRPLEATRFQVENIRMAYVFYESGLSINVLYPLDDPKKRAVGFKLSEGMDVPEELSSFKFARQKSKLAGTIRGSYFVIKGEY